MTCPTPERLAAHSLHPLAELEPHVASCSRCQASLAQLRRTVQALGAYAATLPAPQLARSVVARLAAEPERRSFRSWWAVAGGLVTAALVALVVTPRTNEFTGRGGALPVPSTLGLETYVSTEWRPPRLLDLHTPLTSRDRLSFVAFNRSHQPVWLMVYGLDAKGTIHWFYPAWVDDRTNPEAVRIAAQPTEHALPEAVSPVDVTPGAFRLVTLFLRAPLTVKDVEALVAQGGLERVEHQASTITLHVEHTTFQQP